MLDLIPTGELLQILVYVKRMRNGKIIFDPISTLDSSLIFSTVAN